MPWDLDDLHTVPADPEGLTMADDLIGSGVLERIAVGIHGASLGDIQTEFLL